MALGLYVHIPYCIQRCKYCDFTTFEQNQIMPMQNYIDLVCREIKMRSPQLKHQELASIYFGGGTPSLLPSKLILAILQEIGKAGLKIGEDCEITIEINPATVSQEKLEDYLSYGLNRFSVGAQTFNDRLLKLCGREHNADDTRKTLDLLGKRDLNYTFDLLFALPHQSLAELERDLEEVSSYKPNHLSAYCLTVPTGHSMSHNRPMDSVQSEMFSLIESRLRDIGLDKYEISNFAAPGFESVHNMIYWTDQAYWGVGLSSHSYFPGEKCRFWNPKSFEQYQEQLNRHFINNENMSAPKFLPPEQKEYLALHEWLTDYCHTSMRLKKGLDLEVLGRKAPSTPATVKPKLEKLLACGLVKSKRSRWSLTKKGELLSNLVFSELTFLKDDLPT